MQKCNISIYITELDLVRHNVQTLLGALEDSGANYSMTIEREGEGEDVKVLDEVPVTAGMSNQVIGVAKVLDGGFIEVRLDPNSETAKGISNHPTLGLSVMALAEARENKVSNA